MGGKPCWEGFPYFLKPSTPSHPQQEVWLSLNYSKAKREAVEVWHRVCPSQLATWGLSTGSWIPPRSGSRNRKPGSRPCNELGPACHRDRGRDRGLQGEALSPLWAMLPPKRHTQLLDTARPGSHQEARTGSSRQIKLWGQ